MYNVLIFAGTTEGYTLCRFLAKHKVSVYACVATEYGSKALTENEYLKVSSRRLDEGEMEALFQEIQPEMVLDLSLIHI